MTTSRGSAPRRRRLLRAAGVISAALVVVCAAMPAATFAGTPPSAAAGDVFYSARASVPQSTSAAAMRTFLVTQHPQYGLQSYVWAGSLVSSSGRIRHTRVRDATQPRSACRALAGRRLVVRGPGQPEERPGLRVRRPPEHRRQPARLVDDATVGSSTPGFPGGEPAAVHRREDRQGSVRQEGGGVPVDWSRVERRSRGPVAHGLRARRRHHRPHAVGLRAVGLLPSVDLPGAALRHRGPLRILRREVPRGDPRPDRSTRATTTTPCRCSACSAST